MNDESRSTEAKAFTLVELLVVVAVIALLVSILLPSIGRARRQAQETACQTNLKQLVMGVFYYCDDHGGKMPPFTVTGKPKIIDFSPANKGWAEVIDRYIPTQNVEYVDGQEVFARIHQCPGKRSNFVEGDPGSPVLNSYGLNPYLCSFVSWRINKPNAVFDWVNIDRLKRPAETVVLSESCRMIVAPVLPDPSDARVHGPLITRHREYESSNVAWGDGHVDSQAGTTLIERKQWWDPKWSPEKTYKLGFPAG